MSEIAVRPAEEWFWLRDSGDVELCDPVSKLPINPEAPPTFLDASEELETGKYFYSHRQLGALTIVAWMAEGEARNSHLDGCEGYEFEDVVAQVDTVGYVHRGLNAGLEDLRMAAAREAVEKGALPRLTGDPYLDRLTAAVARPGKVEYYAGVDEVFIDEPGPVEQAIQTMRQEVVRLESSPDTTGPAAAANIIVNNVEQWYSALRMGYALTGIKNIAKKHGQELQNSLLVLPPRYGDFIRKIDRLGVGEAGMLFHQPAMVTGALYSDEQAMRRGYISVDELS